MELRSLNLPSGALYPLSISRAQGFVFRQGVILQPWLVLNLLHKPGLEFASTFLPLLSERWDYRQEPPYPAPASRSNMGYTPCLGNSLELTPIIQRWFCVSTALLDKVWPHSPGWPYILFYFLHLFILGTGEEQVVACVCTQMYMSLCACVQVCVQGDSLRSCSLLSQRSFWGSAQVVRLTLALSAWFLAFTSQVLELLCMYPA